ncbi:MAG: hypothetical protein EOP11_09845 [Proteobacteria bacterium]|nr:MAG: hypothetical protein EOP11_09845 [Pseudomonadota bacterium]
MPKYQRILFATFCALLAGGFTFLVKTNRDFLFENRWHEPYGKFETAEDRGLFEAALASASSEMRGTTCVGEWIGKDERYLYAAIGCGNFKREGDKISVTGDQNYRPLRMEIRGIEVKGTEVVDSTAFENSLRRLYPRVAADRVAVRMNPQLYRERGLAKQDGLPAPAPPPPPAPPGPVVPAK